MKLAFKLKNETKTCYRFESGARPDQITLYLKKNQIKEAGIDPEKGITITVEEDKTNG